MICSGSSPCSAFSSSSPGNKPARRSVSSWGDSERRWTTRTLSQWTSSSGRTRWPFPAQGAASVTPTSHRTSDRSLACGRGAVLSHRSAASHWGLLETQQQGIDVTAPRGRHGAPGIRLHRSRSLDAQDTTSHQAIPITTVPRTLLDLAAAARASELERALAQAERLQLYDHRAIESVIARCNGHRGTTTLATATSHTPKWTRNEWEAAFLDLLREAAMPEPLVNDAFHAPDHGHCEPDYHWPSHPRHRRNRWLGHPPHPRRLPQ